MSLTQLTSVRQASSLASMAAEKVASISTISATPAQPSKLSLAPVTEPESIPDSAPASLPTTTPSQPMTTKSDQYFPIILPESWVNGSNSGSNPDEPTPQEKNKKMIMWLVAGLLTLILLIWLVSRSTSKTA